MLGGEAQREALLGARDFTRSPEIDGQVVEIVVDAWEVAAVEGGDILLLVGVLGGGGGGALEWDADEMLCLRGRRRVGEVVVGVEEDEVVAGGRRLVVGVSDVAGVHENQRLQPVAAAAAAALVF